MHTARFRGLSLWVERSLPVTRDPPACGLTLLQVASGEAGPGQAVPTWGAQLALGGRPGSCCVQGCPCANSTDICLCFQAAEEELGQDPEPAVEDAVEEVTARFLRGAGAAGRALAARELLCWGVCPCAPTNLRALCAWYVDHLSRRGHLEHRRGNGRPRSPSRSPAGLSQRGQGTCPSIKMHVGPQLGSAAIGHVTCRQVGGAAPAPAWWCLWEPGRGVSPWQARQAVGGLLRKGGWGRQAETRGGTLQGRHRRKGRECGRRCVSAYTSPSSTGRISWQSEQLRATPVSQGRRR